MSGLRKGVTYTFRVEFADGHDETCLATSEEQAERIARRKREDTQQGAGVPIVAVHATTEDRPKVRL